MHLSLDRLGATSIPDEDAEGKTSVNQLKNFYENLTRQAELEESLTSSCKGTRRDSTLRRGRPHSQPLPLASHSSPLPHSLVPYSRKIWQFGGLYYNHQIKIHQNFLLTYIRMAIPYRTAKFKSVNILAIVIWGSTAKFNSHQYFWLYGM